MNEMFCNSAGISSTFGRFSNVSNGIFNSKIELKTWIVKFATDYNKKIDDVMALFKDEYEALPLTPNESLSTEFQKSLDSIKDMMSSILDMINKGEKSAEEIAEEIQKKY